MKLQPDIFISTYPHSDLRKRMFDVCREWWKMYGYFAYPIYGTDDQFEWQRRVVAESAAESDIYILSDDDCLPIGDENWLPGALEVIARYPQVGQFSAFPDNENINPWTSEGRDILNNNDLMEHISIGGLRFIRRGIIKDSDWREFNGRDYDADFCGILNDKGYKSCYLKNFKMTHLGKGFSEIWDKTRWLKYQKAE